MSGTNTAVAVVVGDQVVAMSADAAVVRIVAAMLATRPDDTAGPILAEVDAGRRRACQLVALGH